MKNFLAGLGLVILLASCRSAEPVTDYSNNSLYSTLWIQTAAEYEALSHQAYNTSQMLLPLALEDSTWTASLEQGEGYGSLPPAIILDVDETVLDNSYYEARGVIDKTGYDSETWNAWVREAGDAAGVAGPRPRFPRGHRRLPGLRRRVHPRQHRSRPEPARPVR